MKRKAYEKRLEPLQVELNNLARWLQHTGRRMAVVLEGRDTAGKGGVIKEIGSQLNPRQVHVVDIISGHCGPRPGPAWINQTVLFSTGATWTLIPYIQAGYTP